MSGAESLQDQLTELGISVDVLHARGLRRHEEAISLHIAEVGSDGREHCLILTAANAWRELKAQARRDGEEIFIVSAFRGVDRQIAIIRRKLDSGESIEDILSVCAPPGYSEHHTGRAVDLGTPGADLLEPEFERTSAFDWLRENAGFFEFSLSYPAGNSYGYAYEPWHWCYRDESNLAG
jgi:D-alanyl-D-alanine carboxypeptidase